MTTSSSSIPKKQLLKIDPGSYFKLTENEKSRVSEPTTGLVVTTYNEELSGEVVYHVVLVNGELLLIPEEKNV